MGAWLSAHETKPDHLVLFKIAYSLLKQGNLYLLLFRLRPSVSRLAPLRVVASSGGGGGGGRPNGKTGGSCVGKRAGPLIFAL